MNKKKFRPLLAKEIELINRGGIAVKVIKLEPISKKCADCCCENRKKITTYKEC